jgi:hypothetical protein
MFWKRKEKIECEYLGHIVYPPPPPPKKEFETMLELLRVAEKFDRDGEKDVSNAILKNLCEFIERYITQPS